jgi:hypothetical protein
MRLIPSQRNLGAPIIKARSDCTSQRPASPTRCGSFVLLSDSSHPCGTTVPHATCHRHPERAFKIRRHGTTEYPVDTGRLRGVLDLVAHNSEWGRPLPSRQGHGVAVRKRCSVGLTGSIIAFRECAPCSISRFSSEFRAADGQRISSTRRSRGSRRCLKGAMPDLDRYLGSRPRWQSAGSYAVNFGRSHLPVARST